jgi:hypothetical protein
MGAGCINETVQENCQARRPNCLGQSVATADDSNQKDLEAEREKVNRGATPEKEQ